MHPTYGWCGLLFCWFFNWLLWVNSLLLAFQNLILTNTIVQDFCGIFLLISCPSAASLPTGTFSLQPGGGSLKDVLGHLLKLGLKAWKRRSFWLIIRLPPQWVTAQTALSQGPQSLQLGREFFQRRENVWSSIWISSCLYLQLNPFSLQFFPLPERSYDAKKLLWVCETLHTFIKLGKSYSASGTCIYISVLSTPRLFWTLQRNSLNKLKDKLKLVHVFEYSNFLTHRCSYGQIGLIHLKDVCPPFQVLT